MDEQTKTGLWIKSKIEEDTCYRWHIGNRQFKLIRKKNVWNIQKSILPETGTGFSIERCIPESTLDWDKFITEKVMLYLVPALPDKPLVLRPESNFQIMPGTNIQLFVQIPLWIQLFAGSHRYENLISDFSSVELSNTWFGEPDIGIPAYSLNNPVQTIKDTEKILSYEAMCPLQIINESNEILNFQRLALHVEQLDLYTNEVQLFTNEVKVKFKGEDRASDITFSGSKPFSNEKLRRINSPRETARKNILNRGFYFIKTITQY
ncbi:MAG: DUF432 domain-containing protein [Bacteroidales bacterium]|nr:DUF432 domain-containing protein [Bacteroidales bacterium]